MSWYWIVLIVVCYVLLSAVTCIIFSRVAKTNDEIIVLFGIFWPLIVILLPIILLIILLDKIVDKYRYGEE